MRGFPFLDVAQSSSHVHRSQAESGLQHTLVAMADDDTRPDSSDAASSVGGSDAEVTPAAAAAVTNDGNAGLLQELLELVGGLATREEVQELRQEQARQAALLTDLIESNTAKVLAAVARSHEELSGRIAALQTRPVGRVAAPSPSPATAVRAARILASARVCGGYSDDTFCAEHQRRLVGDHAKAAAGVHAARCAGQARRTRAG